MSLRKKSLVLMPLLAAVACHDDTEPDPKRVARWRSSQPDSYVAMICGTGFAAGCTVFAVTDGTVRAAKTQDSTGWKPHSAPTQEDPIEALFWRVDGSSDCDVSVTYDDTYGFVRGYYYDCGQEGSGQAVPCFVADSNDLDACDEFGDVRYTGEKPVSADAN